jgi:hypothetical protein
MVKLKIEKSKSMQEAGSVLMGGGFLIGLGYSYVALFLPRGNKDIEKVTIGIDCVSAALIIPGLIVYFIGKHRTKEYKIKLDDLRSGFYIAPNQVGLRLAFKF